MDYGHPESFFFKNLELLDLGRHFRLKYFQAFGVFLVGLSAPFIFNFQISIWEWDLNLGRKELEI